MAINNNALAEMEVPESYLENLPKVVALNLSSDMHEFLHRGIPLQPNKLCSYRIIMHSLPSSNNSVSNWYLTLCGPFVIIFSSFDAQDYLI